MNEIPERIKKIQEKIGNENIDVLLITCPENKRYLTNFSGSTSWVLVSADRCLILVDGRYTLQAAQECPSIVEQVHITDFVDGFPKELPPTLQKLKAKRLGVEAQHLSLLEARRIEENSEGVTLVYTTGWVESFRIKKSKEEIKAIMEAIDIAQKVCSEALASVKPGMTELDVAHHILEGLNRHGAKQAFEPIVASGERSSMPHGQPTTRKILKGDCIVVDMGAVFQGYHSDLTRTVCAGEPSEDQKKVFELLQKAQEAAYKIIKPGVTGKEADAAARKVLQEAGFGEYFTHGLGHGVGLEIHEAPALRKTSEQILEPGMVITVEPGVYIPDKFGMRLEDDVLVTENGCQVLSTLPQQLKALHEYSRLTS